MQEHDVVGIGNAIVPTSSPAVTMRSWRGMAAARAACSSSTRRRCRSSTRHGAGHRDLRRLGRQHHGRGSPSSAAGPGFNRQDADDQFGEVFATTFAPAGVTVHDAAGGRGAASPPAAAWLLVTPDGQRTMNTFLGVSPQLGGGEVRMPS
jgi:hypothetical protein